MVIYDNAFTGAMEGDPAFHAWMRHIFLTAYPMPFHGRAPMPHTAVAAGFRSVGTEEYRHGVPFSRDRLVDYMVSRSNVNAAVEGGGQSIEEVREWLAKRVEPFFEGEDERRFLFGGPIWYFLNLGSS